jgi:hypothetical protein
MTLNLPRDDFPRRLASASRRAFSMNLDSVVPDSSAALFAWGFRGMLCPLDQVIGQIDSGSHLPKHSLPDDPALPKQKRPVTIARNGPFEFNPGSDLRSHTVTRAVSSAQRGLTSVFGMGTGVTPAIWPPGKSKLVERRE